MGLGHEQIQDSERRRRDSREKQKPRTKADMVNDAACENLAESGADADGCVEDSERQVEAARATGQVGYDEH